MNAHDAAEQERREGDDEARMRIAWDGLKRKGYLRRCETPAA